MANGEKGKGRSENQRIKRTYVEVANFIKDHPSMKLIIIDTFQKIRNDGVEGYNYGADYNILTALKRIADRFDITILLVHHTRKQGAKDVMDTISGTRGISGCVDGTLVLEKETRLGTRGKLSATSREYEDKELILEFDRNSKRWALRNNRKGCVRKGAARQIILQAPEMLPYFHPELHLQQHQFLLFLTPRIRPWKPF